MAKETEYTAMDEPTLKRPGKPKGGGVLAGKGLKKGGKKGTARRAAKKAAKKR